jgi:hypothetical protein
LQILGDVFNALEELEKLFLSSFEFLNDWKCRDHSQPPSEDWNQRVEQNEFFLTTTLPKILKIALNKKITDVCAFRNREPLLTSLQDEMQQNVNSALQRIIQVSVEYFRSYYDLSPLFAMLMEIFDDEYNFYSPSQYSGIRERF